MTKIFNLFVIFTLSGILFFGCKSKEIIFASEPGKDSPDKVNTANQEGKAEDYDQAVAKHYAMQSQRTKDMMAKAQKNNNKVNLSKNRKWFDKFFNNNCNSSSCMVKVRNRYHTVTVNNSCFIK